MKRFIALFCACCVPATAMAAEEKLNLRGTIGPWSIVCDVVRSEDGIKEDCEAVQEVSSGHPGIDVRATLRIPEGEEGTLLFRFPDPNVVSEERKTGDVKYRGDTIGIGARIGRMNIMLPVGPEVCSEGACSSGIKLSSLWVARLALPDAGSVKIALFFAEGKSWILLPISLQDFAETYLTVSDPVWKSDFLEHAYAKQQK